MPGISVFKASVQRETIYQARPCIFMLCLGYHLSFSLVLSYHWLRYFFLRATGISILCHNILISFLGDFFIEVTTKNAPRAISFLVLRTPLLEFQILLIHSWISDYLTLGDSFVLEFPAVKHSRKVDSQVKLFAFILVG